MFFFLMQKAAYEMRISDWGSDGVLFRSIGEFSFDIEELADLKGKLPNSASRTWTAGAGASLITDGGHLGVSFSRYDSLYGVPNRYSVEPEDHDHEEEGEEEHTEHGNVRLDMRPTRLHWRGGVRLGGLPATRRVRAVI